MSPLEQILSDVDETIVLFDVASLDTDGDGEVFLDETPFFEEFDIVTESGTVISGTAAGGSVDDLAGLGFPVEERLAEVAEALDRAEAALNDFAAFRSFSDFDFFI